MAQEHPEPTAYPDRIGSHLLRVDGDTIYMKFKGVLALEEARQMLTRCDAVCRQHGWIFMVADMTHAQPVPQDARKLFATWPLQGHYAIAAYGISSPIRAIMQLVRAARRLLGKQGIDSHVVADEAAARQWVAERRRTLQAAKRG